MFHPLICYAMHCTVFIFIRSPKCARTSTLVPQPWLCSTLRERVISHTQYNTPSLGAQYIHFCRVWMGALLEPRTVGAERATVGLGPPTWPLAAPVAPRCGHRH